MPQEKAVLHPWPFVAALCAVVCLCVLLVTPRLGQEAEDVQSLANSDFDQNTKLPGTLAHPSADGREVAATLFVTARSARHLRKAADCAAVPAHEPCALEAVTADCTWCPSRDGKCVKGRVTAMPAQEDDHPLESGVEAMLRSIADYLDLDHGSGHKFGSDSRVLTFVCALERPQAFAVPGNLTLRVDPLESQPRPLLTASLPSHLTRQRFKGRPVVCGRALFGEIRAELLKWQALHNRREGFSTTIVYEVGLARLTKREALAGVLRSGALTVVDLRDTLQDQYGHLLSTTLLRSKTVAQTLTRHDCMLRARQLNASWALFNDVDEFISPSRANPRLTYAEWLRNELGTAPVAQALLVDRWLPPWCDENGTIPELQARLRAMGRRGVAEAFVPLERGYSEVPKPLVRPLVDVTRTGVHWPHKTVELDHDAPIEEQREAVRGAEPGRVPLRRVRRGDPYLLHLRCLN